MGRARGGWTVEMALAACDPLTCSAARAAAAGRLSASETPTGADSWRLGGSGRTSALPDPPYPVPALKRAGAPRGVIY